MTREHPEHPDAGAELFAAAERYEQAEPGLGHALFDEVAEAIEAIEMYPEGWPPFPGWDREPVVRTKGTKRFHYRVVLLPARRRAGDPGLRAREPGAGLLEAPLRRHARRLRPPTVSITSLGGNVIAALRKPAQVTSR